MQPYQCKQNVEISDVDGSLNMEKSEGGTAHANFDVDIAALDDAIPCQNKNLNLRDNEHTKKTNQLINNEHLVSKVIFVSAVF